MRVHVLVRSNAIMCAYSLLHPMHTQRTLTVIDLCCRNKYLTAFRLVRFANQGENLLSGRKSKQTWAIWCQYAFAKFAHIPSAKLKSVQLLCERRYKNRNHLDLIRTEQNKLRVYRLSMCWCDPMQLCAHDHNFIPCTHNTLCHYLFVLL